jgi:hypothetical protein
MSQRIVALLVVLFSIVIITLGPSFINTITLDEDELWSTINKQKTELQELQNETSRLNKVIRDNQLECTNQIVDREREILEKLAILENNMKNMQSQKRTMMVDTVNSGKRVIQLPDRSIEMMMTGIKDLKLEINKDIENRGK